MNEIENKLDHFYEPINRREVAKITEEADYIPTDEDMEPNDA